MAAIEKVKVLVLGDSGVGKSSLTHLIAHNEPISNPSWTVGCSVEVKLHEFREGTQYQKTYFIELWDVGGSSNHRKTRTTFYNGVHGLIFVHDLTNRKSQQNLKCWLSEVVNRDSYKAKQGFEEYDSEQCAGSNMLPMIFIGTKLDLAGEKRVQGNMMGLDIAQEWGADKINLDNMDPRSLAPGSSSAVKLSRFFNKVIEMRYHKREHVSPFAPDKKRFYTTISPNNTKSYHYD
ncbi:rab-like protein 3 [Cimex lectularius]|uniref:Rab-like protein 3 n=1 Tax=Cimex lectularius TaxID=79782 RepID=A0A8I6RFS6_CIMLE|nr:rab-like protein 3 [Cimex lectularius]